MLNLEKAKDEWCACIARILASQKTGEPMTNVVLSTNAVMAVNAVLCKALEFSAILSGHQTLEADSKRLAEQALAKMKEG